MVRKKKDDIYLEVPKGATLRQIYAKVRREFTAADLQEYTEKIEGVPIEKVIAELQIIQQKNGTKRKKKA